MSLISRPRSARLARTVAVGALSVVAGGLLVACGDDESSATGEPTTTSAVSTSTSAAASESRDGDAPAPAAPAAPNSGDRDTDEQPQAVPSDFPGPTEVPISTRGQDFLDALQRENITPAGDGSIAIATADYICAAQQQGSSNDEITTFVVAAVGTEASASGQQLTVEQAGETAQVYIRVAQSDYC